MRVTPAMLDQANHEELKDRIAATKRMWRTCAVDYHAALVRTTQLLHDILPRLSPADAKTMGIVSAMIDENMKLLGGE